VSRERERERGETRRQRETERKEADLIKENKHRCVEMKRMTD
jgi:hypothetical protein